MAGARTVPLHPEDKLENLPFPKVSLPGWDDVVHLRPDAMLSPKEQLERKRDRAKRIQESGISPLSKSITWAMTQIDNVQDALVTLSVATRLVGLAIPSVRPAAELFGRAADGLNMFQSFTFATPARTASKRALEQKMQRAPGYYMGRAKGATSLAKALPNIAEALQILQTSDQLTGFGISLGAIAAMPTTLTAGLVRALGPSAPPEGIRAILPETDWKLVDDVESWSGAVTYLAVQMAPVAAAAALTLIWPLAVPLAAAAEVIAELGTGGKAPEQGQLDAAQIGLEAVSWLAGNDDTWTPHEHLMMSMTHALAVAFLRTHQTTLPAGVLAAPLINVPIRATPPRNPITRAALWSLGIDPDLDLTFPLRGNPKITTLHDAADELAEIAPIRLASWRGALNSEDQENLAQHLHTYLAQETWPLIEGPSIQIDRSYSPVGRAAVAILDLDLRLPPDFPDVLTYPLLEALAALWEEDDHRKPFPPKAQEDINQVAARLLTTGIL